MKKLIILTAITSLLSGSLSAQTSDKYEENMKKLKPFKIDIPQSILDDLHARLKQTRWPAEIKGSGWNYGSNLAYMKELTSYWLNQYDWRKQEAKLNTFHQFKAEVDGVNIHFIYEHGKGPNPTPIILIHGWPDSFYRYEKLIPMLTDPAKYGGDPNDSFDVIVPSLGAGFSDNMPVDQGPLLKTTGKLLMKLMTEVLGYKKFAAAGGDGGGVTSQILATINPDAIIGLHLTDIGYHNTFVPDPSKLSKASQEFLATLQQRFQPAGAYVSMLMTKPLTFNYGLSDSPVGIASLIIEKFRDWSDCGGDVEKSFTKDELLTNIMLYWVSDLGGTAIYGYALEGRSPSIAPGTKITVPVALALPPGDLTPVPPRDLAELSLNVQHYTVLPHGGHFVALEDPKPLAEDMRAFFKTLKQ